MFTVPGLVRSNLAMLNAPMCDLPLIGNIGFRLMKQLPIYT